MKEEIVKLRNEGKTYNDIALILGCSKSTICYHLGENQLQKSYNRTRKARGLDYNNVIVKKEKKPRMRNYVPRPKREVIGKRCPKCKIPNEDNTQRLCDDCRAKSKVKVGTYYNDATILDVINTGHNKFVSIRGYAKRVMKDVDKVCVNCGYRKHVECAHKKAIKDFPLTALISEVNSPSNLVYLCPNCHWEFDKGLLII